MEERQEQADQKLRVRSGLLAGKATIYGTDWCGFTTKQKAAFDAVKIPYDYINCGKFPNKCPGISSYPTVKDYPNLGDSWVGFKELN